LAAEVRGVLDGMDRATAEQRIARDSGFARQVAAWEQRLAPWAAEIPEMLPAPHVWDRIAGALPPQTPRPGLWQSLAFWRGFSLAAGALAAACIAALVYFGAFMQPEPLVATIEGGGQRHFVATIDVKRGTVATGHCLLRFATGVGLCTVSDGTGALAGFHARVRVTADSSIPKLWHWDGTYSFTNG